MVEKAVSSNVAYRKIKHSYDESIAAIAKLRAKVADDDNLLRCVNTVEITLNKFINMAANKFDYWYKQQVTGRDNHDLFKADHREGADRTPDETATIEQRVVQLIAEGKREEAKKLVAAQVEMNLMLGELRASQKIKDVQDLDGRSFSTLAPAMLRSGGGLRDKDPPKDVREEPPHLDILMPNLCECGGQFKCEKCAKPQIGMMTLGKKPQKEDSDA